jgi:hypothetical protein
MPIAFVKKISSNNKNSKINPVSGFEDYPGQTIVGDFFL